MFQDDLHNTGKKRCGEAEKTVEEPLKPEETGCLTLEVEKIISKNNRSNNTLSL